MVEAELSDIEEKVRTKVFVCIEKSNESSHLVQKHFGKFYASQPHEFEFSSGDRKLIMHLVQNVKDTVKREGYKHFADQPINMGNDEDKANTLGEPQSYTQVLLNKLLEAAKKNANRRQQGYRYDSEIKEFATYIRMIAGPLAYQTINYNLRGAVPSLQSTNRYIQKTYSYVAEGVLRKYDLLSYLKERQLPLIVSLSEDGTRIQGRPQYDRKSNEIVGFTLPINDITGLPIRSFFPARNFKDFCKHFTQDNSVSAHANVVIAQPLGNAPPFCLLVYGFDNNHTANETLNRWTTIVSELKELNIDVLTISSDSAQPYNSAMRVKSKLGCRSDIFDAKWFSCDPHENDPIFVQDTIHVGTKIRNLLLRTLWASNKLQFGKYFIDINHLKELMDKLPKDMHELTPSVLTPTDRQNFPSVFKICSEKVTILLKKHVKNSEGTAKFLEITRMILDSYLHTELTPLERVHKIWYALFMLRIWRQSVISNKTLRLKQNFMTNNCFACIELNAHSLVHIILRLKQMNSPELFLPSFFSSQPCESTFRQVRSFTSTFSTKVNCTVKEFLERLTKIQLQNYITHHLSGVFEFPRLGFSSFPKNHFELPSKNQIREEIRECKQLAVKDAKKLGLLPANKLNLSCGILPLRLKKKHSNKTNSEQLKQTKLPKFRNTNLRNYSSHLKNEPVDERGPYVEVFSSPGKRIVVKKTSLCWMLRNDCQKLSSDRLERVKASVASKKRQKIKSKRKQVKNEEKKTKCLLYGFTKAKTSLKKKL